MARVSVKAPGALPFHTVRCILDASSLCTPVQTISSECDPELLWLKDEENCNDIIYQENLTHSGSSGCNALWDHLNCWPHAQVGETISKPCPPFLRTKGGVGRKCTENGWSEPSPPYELACGYNLNDTLHFPTDTMLVSYEYFMGIRIMYSVGYSISLISLSIALILLGAFRKLHCTRNFIHMQLFLSFILRGVSIFIKDAVLHNSQAYYYCDSHPPGCKVALLISNYCILANYSWLLVEGHYLHSLIHLSLHSTRKRLHWYISLGWGTPMLIISVWGLAKYLQEDEGCWEMRGNGWIWWILRVPVILFIIVNVAFFLRIIRMLVSKMRAPDMLENGFKKHRKLAKSTLLLVSLFGVQYTLFAFFPDQVGNLTFQIWNAIELAMASTQGFIVALLYCFLNGEVQNEIKRHWRRWRLKQCFDDDPRVHHGSLSNSALPLTQILLLNRANNITEL
ncbi:secretin receptor [Electrophorus electricus]|uniref:secretin receptor n=1 Tax=Electrophorus electricus TaxID=8005 RepID=UPI0015D08BAE|nr:secretin receptor [Electrophorus electricus]